MKIVKCSNNDKYIDQEAYDHINNIWATFGGDIADNSGIMYAPNTTINRSIPDYNDNNIKKVRKLEKADYFVLGEITLGSYPCHFDGIHITDDDTQEVVYGIYNFSDEAQVTIEHIVDFHVRGQSVIYIDQNKLNDSLNNGMVLDEHNYFNILELLNSGNSDNIEMAVQMMCSSSLKDNWEWILYLFHQKSSYISSYDHKSSIYNYLKGLNLVESNTRIFESKDAFFKVILSGTVRDKMIGKIKQDFANKMKAELDQHLGSKKFELVDFKLKYNGDT